MRLLLLIPLFFVAAFKGKLNTAKNPVTVTGHIKFRDSLVDVRGMLVVVLGDGKILATTYSNQKRDFVLTFTRDERVFKFYCSAPSIGTKLMGKMRSFESDTPEITFYIPRRSKAK